MAAGWRDPFPGGGNTVRRILLLLGLTAAAASAQSHETNFTINALLTQFLAPSVDAFGNACYSAATGTGTFGPFGSAAVSFSLPAGCFSTSFSLSVQFQNGGQFQAQGNVDFSSDAGQGTVLGSGTNTFIASNGTITFTLAEQGDPTTIGEPNSNFGITLTGSGMLFTYNIPYICGNATVTGSSDPNNCKIWLCQSSSPRLGPYTCVLLQVQGGIPKVIDWLYLTSPSLSIPTPMAGGATRALVFYGPGHPTDLIFVGSSPLAHSVCRDCPEARAAPNTTTSQFEIVTPFQAAAANYSATASCFDPTIACWLTVPTPTGAIAADSAAGITAQVDSAGLNPGAYFGNVSVSLDSGAVLNSPFDLLAVPPGPLLSLSETGVGFQAVAGAATPAAHIVTVSNAGTGTLAFSAAAVTYSGGSWLTVTSSAATAPAQLTIGANPAGLAPGVYKGRVDFRGTGVANLPQSLPVTLTVLASNAATGPLIAPTALVFVAAGNSPAPEVVQITNPSSQTLTVTTGTTLPPGTSTPQGNGWLSVSGSGATLTASQPVTETVTVNTAGLAAGVYTEPWTSTSRKPPAITPSRCCWWWRAAAANRRNCCRW